MKTVIITFMWGELTFTPGNGTSQFDPIEWDYKFGEMLKLPEKFLND